MDNFDRCFAFTLAAEAGFTNNPGDPGNWTGGAVGQGLLKGTKFGVSAAAYPGLDIANLTQEQAAGIYRRDYFAPLQGDELALPVAMVAFDGAVNAGLRRAVGWLQQAAGLAADGALGPQTLVALNKAEPLVLAREALARRLEFYTHTPGWSQFGLGWTRRVIALAVAITASA
jgi:lysozyme family protein